MILKAIGPGILPVKNTMIEIFHENTIHWDQNDQICKENNIRPLLHSSGRGGPSRQGGTVSPSGE